MLLILNIAVDIKRTSTLSNKANRYVHRVLYVYDNRSWLAKNTHSRREYGVEKTKLWNYKLKIAFVERCKGWFNSTTAKVFMDISWRHHSLQSTHLSVIANEPPSLHYNYTFTISLIIFTCIHLHTHSSIVTRGYTSV